MQDNHGLVQDKRDLLSWARIGYAGQAKPSAGQPRPTLQDSHGLHCRTSATYLAGRSLAMQDKRSLVQDNHGPRYRTATAYTAGQALPSN